MSLASLSLTVPIIGRVYVDSRLGEENYTKVGLSVIPDLCEDILLGQDFIKMHKEVTIRFGGRLPPLSVCGMAAALVQAPKFFSNLLPSCKPIATRSCNFSREDKSFIGREIDRLLKEDIIETSTSPWRAQVVVIKPENHKKDWSLIIHKWSICLRNRTLILYLKSAT